MELQFEHLIGLPHSPERRDCFELVRDFYRVNFGIEITRYPVPNDWDADKLDLVNLIAEREGFRHVPDWSIKCLRPGDVLALSIGASNANHLAIYLGGNEMLHHPLFRASRKEAWANWWNSAVLYVLRHPDVPDMTVQLPHASIQELNNARYL